MRFKAVVFDMDGVIFDSEKVYRMMEHRAAAKYGLPDEKVERVEKLLADKPKGQVLVGFSMESENMLENSRRKLEKKNVDMICANNVKEAGAGFQVDTNVITLITADGIRQLPLMSKEDAALAILDRAREMLPDKT